MKVGLVTTWQERCGLAAYSENIVKHLPEIDWRIIGREDWGEGFNNLPSIAATCDVVHIMHQGGLMASLSPEIVAVCGKTVITRHCTGEETVFAAATIKTAHIPLPGYRLIRHGIPIVSTTDVASLIPPAIGCAGIPFNGKGHWEAVQIAEQAGWGVNLVMPENPHTSDALSAHIAQYCADHQIPCTLETRWLPEDEVVRILARSTINVFYYTRWANGISGAVRLGLAANRPVIVSQHSQFADIIPTGYVNVVDTIEDAAALVRVYPTLGLVWPHSLVTTWGYDKTARQYEALYHELCR